MDEEKEVEWAKNNIDKEVGEIEASLAREEEQLDFKRDFFSEDSEEIKTIKNKIDTLKSNLESLKWIQKFGEERLINIRKKKIREKAEQYEMARRRLSAIHAKHQFLDHTVRVLRGRFIEREFMRVKRFKILEGVLTELLGDSNKKVRKQLRIILERWEKRLLFFDRPYKARECVSISEEEKKEDSKHLNKYIRAHPEPLLYHLYKTGQMTDLTEEDMAGINEWVKKKRKEDPFCYIEEIKDKKQIYGKREVECQTEKMETKGIYNGCNNRHENRKGNSGKANFC